MQDRAQQFKELFHSEYGRMFKAAYILLGDEDEAKDVVQDVFARLWDGTTPLREESQRTFLLTCVRNRCLNELSSKSHRARSNGRVVRFEGNANIIAQRQNRQEAMLLLTAEAIDSGTHDEQLIEAVNRYVEERLTPQTGRIIKMHYNEERSYKDISSELGISLSAVNKHIVQGLRKLRSNFKNREA